MNSIGSVNYSIEKQIVACVFLNPEAAVYIFSRVEANDFSQGIIREIYDKAYSRYKTGRSFDSLDVCYDFEDSKKQLVRKTIFYCCEECVSTQNYTENVRTLIKQSFARRLGDYADELTDLSLQGCTVEEIKDKLSEGLQTFEEKNDFVAVSANQGYANFISELDTPRNYFLTGFENVDSHLKISKGDYIVIGARPSVGKTAFALQIGWNMASKSADFVNVVFFSFETSSRKIYDRIIANQESIPFEHIVNGTVTPFEKQMVQERVADTELVTFDVVEASGMTVNDIQAEALKRKADVIFIDYIGLVSGNEKTQVSSYERMTQISKDLHIMAQKRKITVIALSQLNREGKEKPTLTNLRDSGQVEQDADAVILLSKLKVKDNPNCDEWREVQIAKNKEGELGSVAMFFNGKYQRFSEPKERPEFVY